MSITKPLDATLSPDPSILGRDDPSAESGPALHETVIRARPGWIGVNWGELIHSHELFATLVQRDLMVRYKQSVLGVAWAVIQPVLTMVVYTIIFGRLAGIKSDVPYAAVRLHWPGALDCSSPTRSQRRRRSAC